MIKKIFLGVIIIITFSCGGNPNSEPANRYIDDILGFWDRVGTIQLMNGIPVDTLAFKDSENPIISR